MLRNTFVIDNIDLRRIKLNFTCSVLLENIDLELKHVTLNLSW